MKKKTENILEMIPTRLVEHTADEAGTITLHVPRFKTAWMRKLFLPKKKNPVVNVTLDAFGSHVWLSIDGSHSVHAIASSLLETYGDAVEPVYNRVGTFVNQLTRNEFISLRRAESQQSPSNQS